MTPSNLHTVLGASGGAGNAIARALHDAGLPVRAVNRSGRADLPDTIERRAADVTTEAGAAAAADGSAVVYMAAQPPYHRWPEEFPGMLERVIDATATAGAKLVMVDNLYGYGPGTGTMTEDTPERATDRKGTVRRTMTRTLLDAHRAGRLRVAVGRASDYYGPRADNSGITVLAIEPVAAEGKTIRWTGSLDAPHSVAYLPDIARAYVILGTDERADGGVWILPHGAPVTGRAFLDTVNRALPEPRKTGLISKTMLRLAAPFHRISRETLDILFQWTDPFVADDTRFQETFGHFETTPLDRAVADTVAWYRGHRAP
jgi:nucleoside-diphosphate-sugar epimerase